MKKLNLIVFAVLGLTSQSYANPPLLIAMPRDIVRNMGEFLDTASLNSYGCTSTEVKKDIQLRLNQRKPAARDLLKSKIIEILEWEKGHIQDAQKRAPDKRDVACRLFNISLNPSSAQLIEELRQEGQSSELLKRLNQARMDCLIAQEGYDGTTNGSSLIPQLRLAIRSALKFDLTHVLNHIPKVIYSSLNLWARYSVLPNYLMLPPAETIRSIKDNLNVMGQYGSTGVLEQSWELLGGADILRDQPEFLHYASREGHVDFLYTVKKLIGSNPEHIHTMGNAMKTKMKDPTFGKQRHSATRYVPDYLSWLVVGSRPELYTYGDPTNALDVAIDFSHTAVVRFILETFPSEFSKDQLEMPTLGAQLKLTGETPSAFIDRFLKIEDPKANSEFEGWEKKSDNGFLRIIFPVEGTKNRKFFESTKYYFQVDRRALGDVKNQFEKFAKGGGFERFPVQHGYGRGISAVHAAANVVGDTSLLEYFHELGLDLNLKDFYGATPLDHAIRSQNYEGAKKLVGYGVPVTAEQVDALSAAQ